MNFIITKEQYLTVKQQWANSNSHSSSDIIIYNLLRGFPADRGFSPLIKQTKITSNCGNKWNGYNMALQSAKNLLTEKDTSLETWLKKYVTKTTYKKNFLGIATTTPEEPKLSDWDEKRRPMAIEENKRNKDHFFNTFGLLLDVELATLLLAGLGEKK